MKWELRTEIVVIVAAFVSLVGTVGAISFGSIVSHLKDIEISDYKTHADLHIAQANERASQALVSAIEAYKQTQEVAKDNIGLHHRTEEVDRFTKGISAQQQGLARQMLASQSISDEQIAEISRQLKRFAGQQITFHTAIDAHVQRLAMQLTRAFEGAGISVTNTQLDFGADYQGLRVVVKTAPRPPLADAIMDSFESVGLHAKGQYWPNTVGPQAVAPGEVTIVIGPE